MSSIVACPTCSKLMHKNGKHLHRCSAVQKGLIKLINKQYKKNVRAVDYVKHTDWQSA